MNYLKSILFGALIWAVAFVVVSVFIGYGVDAQSMASKLVTTLAVALTAYFLARSLNVYHGSEMLRYSALWVLTGLVLDYLVTVKYTGMAFFSRWDIWISYAVILLAPLLAVKKGISAGS